MTRFLRLLVLTIAFAWTAQAKADDIATAGRGVTRIIVALEYPDGRTWVSFGSGFAVSPSRVVTNYHVVELYDRYAQHASDGFVVVVPSEGNRPFAAQIVQINRTKDLALLEISGGSLPPLRVLSSTPTSGEQITALGYPGNVDLASAQSARDFVMPTPYTRSGGEYSSSRVVSGINAYLHDAQLARGHSGGPMVDRCGRVLGVNTVITRSDDGEGSFAFAVSNHELLTFLGEAGMSPVRESGACVTTEERRQQQQLRINQEMTAARDDCEQSNAARVREADQAASAIEERNQARSEERLFIALALFVLGGLALGASGVLLGQKSKQAMIASGVTGGVLIIGSVVLFILRGAGAPAPPPPPTLGNCEAAATDAREAVIAAETMDAAADALKSADSASNAQ